MVITWRQDDTSLVLHQFLTAIEELIEQTDTGDLKYETHINLTTIKGNM